MKFELVEFYPVTDQNRGKKKKNMLGTVHIYVIDIQLDIRGIRVVRKGKDVFFCIPHVFDLDHETGEKIRYPIFRWTDQKTHDEMMNFLNTEVKSLIFDKLNTKGKR